MMRVATSYAGSYGTTFENFLVQLNTDNISGVQLIPDQSPNLYSEIDATRAASLAEILHTRNLTCHLHNVFYDINIVSLVPDVQEFALKISERVFALAQRLSAVTVTVHPGYMYPGWRSDQTQSARFWKAAQRGLTSLRQISSRFGVRALLENGSYHVTTASGRDPRPLHVGVEPVELKQLLDFTDGNIGLSFDFNKAIDSGTPVSEFLRLVGTSIEQVQIGDVSKHSNQWNETKNYLKRHKADCWVVLEGPTGERNRTLAAVLQG